MACSVSAAAARLQWSTLPGYHPHPCWQVVADEIRASSSGVLVEIVPCDLGRATGVATLCAAAERRDVTLAVLIYLVQYRTEQNRTEQN